MPNVPKVRAGEPFRPKADHWNAFVDQIGGGTGGASPLTGEGGDDHGVIWLKNNTSGTLDKSTILGIGTAILSSDNNLTEFRNKPLFNGETPTTASYWNKPAILLEAIPAGKNGRALVSGVCAVQVDVQNTNHRWADVKDSSTSELKSYATGSVRLLSTPSSTGVQWCLVRLGQVFKGPLRGLTDAAISKGSAGNVSIYNGSGTDTTFDVSAENLFATTVASGKKVHVVEIEGATNPIYNLSAAEC